MGPKTRSKGKASEEKDINLDSSNSERKVCEDLKICHACVSIPMQIHIPLHGTGREVEKARVARVPGSLAGMILRRRSPLSAFV